MYMKMRRILKDLMKLSQVLRVKFLTFLKIRKIVTKSYASLLLFLFISIFAVAASQNDVVVRLLNAQVPRQQANEINVEWLVEREARVKGYHIRRKMSHENDFSPLAQVRTDAGRPEGNLVRYQYLDRNVFKPSESTEPIIYALHVEFNDGELRLIGQAEVNYTSTAIRRTWGSIKAMFQ